MIKCWITEKRWFVVLDHLQSLFAYIWRPVVSLKHFSELILLAALWGASFLFMRVATPEFGAVLLIELRVLIAALVLLPFWLVSEPASVRRTTLEHWQGLTIVGLLNSAIPFVLFAYSTLYITGGFASILNATAPIWGGLVAWIWLRRVLQGGEILGLVIGFLGVILLVSGSLEWSMQGKTLGVLAAFSAPILYGVAANYTSEKLSHLSPLTIATFSQFSSAIVLLPFTIWFLPTQAISLHAWLSVIALAVFCTSLAYLLYFRLIAAIGSTRAITVTFLIPVFGMLWGLVFLEEQVSVSMLVGTSVILAGTALVNGFIKIGVARK